MESTPVSRASLETRCGGIRLQSCPSTLSLDAVGLVFLFFTSAEWQSQRAMPTTFFLCFSQDSYGMPVCLMPRLDVFGLAKFHNGNSNMFYILYHRLRPNGSGDSSIYVLSRRSVTTIDTGAYLYLKLTEFSGALGSEAA